MKKIVVEIYFPVALCNYEVRIPQDVLIGELNGLIAKSFEQISGSLYLANEDASLCMRDTGEILDIGMTACELGLRTGSRLMLI